MQNTRARILAWGLCGLAILGAGVQVYLWASHHSSPADANDLLELLGLSVILPITFSVLAALIIAHPSGSRVGWLMMISALGSVNPVQAILRSLPVPPTVASPGIWLLLWLDNWSWVPLFFPIFLIPLNFPTGRPHSARWNWVNRLALGMAMLLIIAGIFIDRMAPVNIAYPPIPNPIGFLPLDFFEGPVFMGVWGVGLITVVSASVISLFVRYRRSAIRERQQIKWLLFAGGMFLLVFLSMLLMPPTLQESAPVGVVFLFSILGIPTAIAVAIFRYRLWDLEVVINRALVYGPLTTLLAGTFAMVIAITTELTKQTLGEESRALGAAVSAVIVAVVFQPLRGWIENVVDKRFYPHKLDLATGLVEVQPEYWGFVNRGDLLRLALEHVSGVLGTKSAAYYGAVSVGNFELEQQVNGAEAGRASLTLSDKQRREIERKRVAADDTPGALTGYVPVFVDRGKEIELLGLLSIGARQNGKGYSGDDLKGLVELGGKLGLALNAIRWALGHPVPGIKMQAGGTADPTESSALTVR